MSPRLPDLGPLELQILGNLSPSLPLSVADIQLRLKEVGNDLAYTTVMTVMTRLFKKGHLKRMKKGRQFVYTISLEREKVRRSIFDRVKSSLFKGRLNPILALLDSKDQLSIEELLELRKAIDEKIKSTKGRE